jgi:hypothetical protein
MKIVHGLNNAAPKMYIDDIKFKTLHKSCHNAVSNTDKNLLITYPGPESKSYYLNS